MTTQEEARIDAQYKKEIEALVSQDIDRDEMVKKYTQITRRYAADLCDADHGDPKNGVAPENETYGLYYEHFANVGWPLIPEKPHHGTGSIKIGPRPAHWDK